MPPFYKSSPIANRESTCAFSHKWGCKCYKRKDRFDKNEKLRKKKLK